MGLDKNGWQTVRCPRCQRPCYLIETPVGWNLVLVDCEDSCRARERFVKPGWIVIDRSTVQGWGGSWEFQKKIGEVNA